MFIVDRKYWLLSIAAGLAAGPLGVLFMLISGSRNFSTAFNYSSSWFTAAMFLSPALFGAVFVYCLRSTVGINWWRGLCSLLGIVAAHNGAVRVAVEVGAGLYDISDTLNITGKLILFAPFTYGATFALVVAAIVALLFPPARSARLVTVIVLASGLVSFSYWPLQIVPYGGGFFISVAAAWIAFGFVYAVVAALLGWRLFEQKTRTNG